MTQQPSTSSSAERAARTDVLESWARWACDRGQQPTMESMERIVSSHGLYPAHAYAETFGRDALLIYLGAAWGIGPKATWPDRVRMWWRCRRG